jgi:hypothetical protein
MNDEAEAQEIQGTVVGSGRFPEHAADDPREPADVAGPADVSDPEDQEDQEAERPAAADPGYGHVAADHEAEDEAEDNDEDEDDEDDEDEDEDDDLTDPDAVIIAEVDEEPGDDEVPEPVAGFARTPVASPANATVQDGESDASTEDAETAAAVDHDAAEAATVPESDVIAEAARPGVPKHAGVAGAATTATAGGPGGDPVQLREQWSAIQSSFVDDPRASVAAASELVNEAITTLVATIAERERSLRGEWEDGSADTENLRNALRGYRGLLDQITGR